MNNQQISQVLTFYRTNFDFHDPYKFLLDGNFIKLLLERQIDFKKRLENTITGKIKLYIPSCLVRQLELLGPDFRLVFEKAKVYLKIPCKHPLEVGVDRCIRQTIIGFLNAQKYIVCTQDIQLRRQLREVLNCPLMYFGPDQRIRFEDVQKKNLQLIYKRAEQKLLPKSNELAQIKELSKKIQEEQRKKIKKQQLKTASQLGVKIKTKRAKGPNPLSIKKKKDTFHQTLANKVFFSRENEQRFPSHLEQNDQLGNPYSQVKKKRIRKKKKKTFKNQNSSLLITQKSL